MDIKVKPAADGASWTMADLLGRDLGRIIQTGATLSIEPAGHAIETMGSMKLGPFGTLDEALRQIESHTHDTCRIEPTDAGESGSIPVDKLNASNDE
jgi:hypothetical protein